MSTRKFLATIPVDAATVALGAPSVVHGLNESYGPTEHEGAVVAHTGSDGSYPVYMVTNDAGLVVGAEVVISSPSAERDMEALVVDKLGWLPDKFFYRRYFDGVPRPDEAKLYNEYLAIQRDNWASIMDGTVASLDPSEEAEPIVTPGDVSVADGRLVACDPWCPGSDVDIAVAPGWYRCVRWASRRRSGIGDGTLRIGMYHLGSLPA